MRIKVLEGHLTSTNKKHIKIIFENNLQSKYVKVNGIEYFIEALPDGNWKAHNWKKMTLTIGDVPKMCRFDAIFKVL